MLVAIIGSYRQDAYSGSQREQDGAIEFPSFSKACRALGQGLAREGHQLLLGWSQENATRDMKEDTSPYDATADYHVLMGYMDTLIDSESPPSSSIRIVVVARDDAHIIRVGAIPLQETHLYKHVFSDDARRDLIQMHRVVFEPIEPLRGRDPLTGAPRGKAQ